MTKMDPKLKLILSYYIGKKVAILGYQPNGGEPRAKFLRKNGVDVVIGLRLGDELWGKAEKDGFDVYTVWEAVEQSNVAQVW